MLECKKYSILELRQELNIPENQWRKRRADLLLWFNNFFDYEIVKEGRENYFVIKDIYEEYISLTRNAKKASSIVNKYEQEVESIMNYADYTNGSAVGRKIVKKHRQPRGHKVGTAQKWSRTILKAHYSVMEKAWCVYLSEDKTDFRVLTEEELELWKEVLNRHSEDTNQAAALDSEYEEGEITKEEYLEKVSAERGKRFKNAHMEYRDLTGLWPVFVPKWSRNAYDNNETAEILQQAKDE